MDAQTTAVVAGRVRLEGNAANLGTPPVSGWVPGEVHIAGTTVRGVYPAAEAPAAPDARRYDVANSYVLPGAVDAHVHSLSEPGEGIMAATRAAAAGGVTTIVEMPFDKAGPINTLDRLHAKQELADREAHVDVALLGTLSNDGGWRQAEAISAGGVVGFKVSLFLTDVHRFPRIDDFQLLDVMRAVAETGRTLCVHAENNEIVKSLLAIEGESRPTDPRAHTRTRPPVSEQLGVLTAMEVAAEMGTALHLCHLSVPRSVDLVSWYRGQGADITLETCPHYLTFTDDDLNAVGGKLKVNPPLRDGASREGMWARIDRGDITVVSSDHAPWPLRHKDLEHILDNHSGMPGVETLVPVALGQALARARAAGDASLTHFSRMVDALTTAPAERFGIDHRKGSLAPGKDADLIVFDPESTVAVSNEGQHSNAGWTPYAGMAPGQITHTFSRGKLIFSASAGLTAVAGRGELLTRHGAESNPTGALL